MRAASLGLFTAVGLACLPAPAAAQQVVSLNFEGVNAAYPSFDYAQIREFYNGGSSNQGTSGTNFGASFGSNALAICLNTPGNGCSNTSRGGLGDPNSQLGGLFFLEGDETFLNFAAGFTTGFSFNYAAVNQGGDIQVFDGLNGTGTLLATLTLGTTPSSCAPGLGAFCPFVAAGVGFAGTARSISFGGVADQIVFDDITFGSVTPGPGVPEPAAWGLMIVGMGAVGGALRLRRAPRVRFA